MDRFANKRTNIPNRSPSSSSSQHMDMHHCIELKQVAEEEEKEEATRIAFLAFKQK